MKIYLGVDPGGSSGCIAALASEQGLTIYKMPRDADAIVRLFSGLSAEHVCFAVVEDVHSFSTDGHVGAFSFGRNVGCLDAALAAAGIPRHFVAPQRWQSAFGLLQRSGTKLTKSQKKHLSRDRAHQEFPGHKFTLVQADAILLAVYCQKTAHIWSERASGLANRQVF